MRIPDLAANMESLTGWVREMVKNSEQLPEKLVCSARHYHEFAFGLYPLEARKPNFDICCHVPLYFIRHILQ